MTLETYLRESFYRTGIIDHAIRATVSEGQPVAFYIHPSGKDGLTADYVVEGNMLASDPAITRCGTVEVIVNGRLFIATTDRVSYWEIAKGPADSVTYRGADSLKPEGILRAGESVKVKKGTIFNVADTSHA